MGKGRQVDASATKSNAGVREGGLQANGTYLALRRARRSKYMREFISKNLSPDPADMYFDGDYFLPPEDAFDIKFMIVSALWVSEHKLHKI